MDSSIRSRKRTRSSTCDELKGTFTRSKSRICLHRNRSGYARPDSTRDRFIKAPVATGDSLLPKEVKLDVKVKDLRARRVFSPSAATAVDGHGGFGGDDDDDDVSKGAVSGVDNVIKESVDLDDDVMEIAEVDVCEKSEGDGIGADDVSKVGEACEKIDGGGGGGVDLVCDDVIMECEVDVCKMNIDGGDADVGKGGEIGDADVIKGGELDDVCMKIDGGDVDVNDGDDVIQGGEIGDADVIKAAEVGVCQKSVGEVMKGDGYGGAKEVVDANKSQSTVTSLRARRKVFKSPSSFSYRRLLPYLQDIDSSNFEMVDAKLPKKNLKLANNAPNMVAHGEQEISAVSVGINLTDEIPKSASEEQYPNKVNPEVIRNVESSDVVLKSQDDVLNDILEECEQTTPPDADIYRKPKTDKMLDVVVKPKPKPVLAPCSRMKMLHTPTSFTHRRLLPFLMNVAEDGLATLKGNQSSKVVKGIEQIQQPPTLSLLHQNVGTDESKIISNPERQDAANDKSDSPTFTLISVDTSLDRIKTATLVSSDNLLDTHGPDMECSESATQLEVNSQSEAVEFDNSIKLELSSPEDNSKRVEEATVKAIENVSNICTEQITDADNDFTGLGSSSSEVNQELVNESAHPKLQITPLMTPGVNGDNCRNGILKRTPRGCRGICNCLNCTSFRLHAERSFEFSRNQMHDAEEVALELISDLTSLRKVLETTVNGSNSLATDKEKQIKEACEKALCKEEAAKARLSQMNEDLSFHCRSMKLMRPNVTFANKIEEKFIPKDVCGKKRV